MKRVIHISNQISHSGGVEVYISQLQKLLPESGWRSDWVALIKNGDRVEVQSDSKDLAWEGLLSEFSTSELGNVFKDGVGLFHVHSLSEPRLLEALFEMAPVVRTAHEPRMVCPGQGKFFAKYDTICNRPFGIHCLIDAYQKRCCNRHPKRLSKAFLNVRYEINMARDQYAKVLANSQYSYDLLREVGFPSEKVETLHYFTPKVIMVDGEFDDNMTVLFVGRLSRTKGVHLLLKSMKMVLQKNSTVKLRVVGGGSDEEYFKALAKELKIEQSVTFLGWSDRSVVEKEIGKASVVSFPSIYPEAFGISGIEAMMRAKAVVGFDVGGVSDWLEHEKTGILVTAGAVEDFANGILKLVENVSLRNQMGNAGREVALKKFSASRHMDRLTAIYKNSLDCWKK